MWKRSWFIYISLNQYIQLCTYLNEILDLPSSSVDEIWKRCFWDAPCHWWPVNSLRKRPVSVSLNYVPQGSVLGPLFFNIFLNDLFFLPLNSYMVNYTDDNHICLGNENLEVLQKHLQDDSNIAVKWFNNNQTTANPDKFQSIISSRHRVDKFDISLDGHVITRGNTLKMLGVTPDDKLNFNEHIRNMCQTASCQINALKRISNFLNEQCRMHVYKSFNAMVYCDKSLAYEDMLKRSGQLCIRLNLLRLLAIEMLKCMNSLNSLYINDMFSGKDSSYNLRYNSRLMQPKFNTKKYGYKSFKYLGSEVWNCLLLCVKNVNDLNLFKKSIYNWCLTDHAKNLPEQLEVWPYQVLWHTETVSKWDFCWQHLYITIYSMNMIAFVLQFHWICPQGVLLTTCQHGFGQWLGAVQAIRHYLSLFCVIPGCKHTLPGLIG